MRIYNTSTLKPLAVNRTNELENLIMHSFRCSLEQTLNNNYFIYCKCDEKS